MPPREVFGAQEHLDKTEGKQGTKVVGWFTDRHEAERVSAELPGVMGGRNTLGVVEATLYDSAEEYPDFDVSEEARNKRIQALEAELAELRSQKS